MTNHLRLPPRRGTAIVEYDGAVLLTETSRRQILLPGGGANRDESRFEAAIRELREETGLIATHALVLFDHRSHSNRHRVVWIQATGTPRPMDDAVALHYGRPETIADFSDMSPATRSILKRFWRYQQEHAALFQALTTHRSWRSA